MSAPQPEPAAEPAPPSATKPAGGGSTALLALAAVIAGLHWFADLLTPLALAVFLWLTIDAFADALRARLRFLPRALALPAALLAGFGGLAFVVAFVVEYARGFSGSIGAYQARIDALLSQAWAMLPVSGPPPTLGELATHLNPAALLSGVADVLQGFGGQAVFVLIYVACLFAAQASLPRKIALIFPERGVRARAMRVGEAVRVAMERYLWVQTVTGLMIAAASWAVFAALGLDNALFWALVAFLLSYIPVIGGAAASLLPALFALVQFPGLGQAVAILAATQAIQFVVGNVIQPRMTGNSLNISVLFVFLSLAFWGKLWGGAGMFLAVPLTVMLMIVLAQFPSTRWMAVAMSHDGRPDAGAAPPPRGAAPASAKTRSGSASGQDAAAASPVKVALTADVGHGPGQEG